jgi:hypothetical protein
VVVFYSDLVKGPTVVACDINFLALYSKLMVVAVSEDIDTDDDQGNVEDISNDEEDCVK